MIGVDVIVSGIFGILDRIIPDKNAAAKAKAEIEMYTLSAEFQQNIKQMEVNAKEGEHESIFVAGWRPWIGWVCGAALTWQFVILPIFLFLAIVLGHPIPAPEFDTFTLINILIAMLGMGGLRTYEKLQINKQKERDK